MSHISKHEDKKLSKLNNKNLANSPVVNAWAAFLDQRDWQLFSTFTTSRELTLKGARRSISKLHLLLKQNNYPAEIFWCSEPYDVKEGQHIHALIKFVDLDPCDDNRRHLIAAVDGWRQVVSDKKARVYSERYKKYETKDRADGSTEITGGANFYLGKYLQKYNSDQDLFLPFSEHNKNLEFDHSNSFRPEAKHNFKNRKEFTAWKYKMIMQAKELKAEVKDGCFYARDNSVYSGSDRYIKNLDYKFLEASMEKDQYSEIAPAVILKAKGRKVKYTIKRKDTADLQLHDQTITPDPVKILQSQKQLKEKILQYRKDRAAAQKVTQLQLN